MNSLNMDFHSTHDYGRLYYFDMLHIMWNKLKVDDSVGLNRFTNSNRFIDNVTDKR